MSNSKFQSALITGASSGIGEALCVLFAKQGISLLITGRNTEKLNDMAKELGKLVPVTIHTADLADSKTWPALLEKVKEQKPDLIINNAGFGLYGAAADLSVEEQLDMIHVNIDALLMLTTEGVKIMKKKGGVILNVSSAASFQPYPYFATYGASKAFVTSFSEAVNEELRGTGVHVLTSCPGQVATEFGTRASKGSYRSRNDWQVMNVAFAAEEIWKQILSCQPVRIFDWKYRIATFLSRYLVPRRALFSLMRSVIRKRFE